MLPKRSTERITDLNIYPLREPKNSSSKEEISEDFAAAYFSNGSWLSERKVSPHLNKDRITPAGCRKPVRMSVAAMASAVLSLPGIPVRWIPRKENWKSPVITWNVSIENAFRQVPRAVQCD